MNSQYPLAKCVYIDVDHTLYFDDGELNANLVKWIREEKDRGMELVLWSSRGRDHAIDAAERAGLVDVFDAILSKPGRIVDDVGWAWTRHTVAIRPDLSVFGVR